MKKSVSIALASGMLFTAALSPAFAEDSISVGDYLEMGSYYGEPILWRCVDINDNGPLMLSDRIICLKPFDAGGSVLAGSHARGYENGRYRQYAGSCYWGDSNMRSWLNSNESAGKVTWLCGNPPDEFNEYGNAYADEAGFETNFTARELEAVRTTEQDSLLMRREFEDMTPYGSTEFTYIETKDTPAIERLAGNANNGAYSERLSDTFFLLDAVQANAVYENRAVLGDDYYIAKPTSGAVQNAENKNGIGIDYEISEDKTWPYWLRTPDASNSDGYGELNIWIDGDVHSSAVHLGCIGVRPAFYLDDHAELYGSGSEAAPYRVYDITVTVNGSKVVSDRPPLIIGGTLMVPARAIFEALGASVDWNEETRTVTAQADGRNIRISIGDDKLYVNDIVTELEAPARIINGRTLIPISAAADASGTTIDRDEAAGIVNIK